MKTLLELIALLRPWPGNAPDREKAVAREKVDAKTARNFAHAELDGKGVGLNPPNHLIFG